MSSESSDYKHRAQLEIGAVHLTDHTLPEKAPDAFASVESSRQLPPQIRAMPKMAKIAPRAPAYSFCGNAQIADARNEKYPSSFGAILLFDFA